MTIVLLFMHLLRHENVRIEIQTEKFQSSTVQISQKSHCKVNERFKMADIKLSKQKNSE